MLKIYHLDLGYRGAITVVANNLEEAKTVMANSDDFSTSDQTQIVEHDIKSGVFLETFGDR